MLEAECFLISESFTLDSGCLFSFKHFIVFTQHVLFVTISLFSYFFQHKKTQKKCKKSSLSNFSNPNSDHRGGFLLRSDRKEFN